MRREYDHKCYEDSCSAILPSGMDICVGRDDCEVQANITVERVHSVRIWGTVTDCMDCPVANALVKLLRYTGECDCTLKEVCRTYTDVSGDYQFDLERGCQGRYRVLVGPCARLHQPPREACEEHRTLCQECGSRCKCGGKPCECRSTPRNCIQYY